MAENSSNWKDSLQSEESFRDFITQYFKEHSQLTGMYDIPSYYEHYTVRLDSKEGIVITLETGVTPTGSGSVAPLPFKQKESMSIEDFRKLILHKKFADSDMSLADVFQTVAGVPSSDEQNKS
ncbi:hypothetical protein LASUN_23460 [Lentilactobacillus sunkii]|jgi:hypothetical protein|uniref:Uncharacterized protein n=1 Tax=Lentilactobacillus sunkii TaxID=481719 RepID=A0A1E7X9S1_9LACO|nr:hypothetical protein [Lentilactobacillus sunkii]OFA09864.1 hypothetical protein LASUN_23460 [Lentilactobacillus sunkii]